VKSLFDSIRQNVISMGIYDKPAVTSVGGQSITFGALLEEPRSLDVWRGHGRLALLQIDSTIEGVSAYAQFQISGYSTLLVPISAPRESLDKLTEAFAPDVVVTPQSLQDSESVLGRYKVCDSESINESRWTKRFNLLVRSDARSKPIPQQMILLLTSGSLGSPKAVRLGSLGVVQNAVDIIRGLDISLDDRAVLNLPISYSYGLSILHSHLLAGASLFTTDTSFIQRSFVDELNEHKVTTMGGVPATYETLTRLGFFKSGGAMLKKFSQAGGRLSADIVREIAQVGARKGFEFQPMYGQTEATARISIMPKGVAEYLPDHVGRVVASGKLSVGTTNHPNEVVFSGTSVMFGYAQDETDLYRPDTQCGLLPTGDLGEVNHGFLKITGRLSRFVKHRGVRVSLDDIQSSLNELLSTAVVQLDDRVVIAVKGDLNCETQIASRMQSFGFLKRDYEVRVLDEIPRTDSGKVNYRLIMEML